MNILCVSLLRCQWLVFSFQLFLRHCFFLSLSSLWFYYFIHNKLELTFSAHEHTHTHITSEENNDVAIAEVSRNSCLVETAVVDVAVATVTALQPHSSLYFHFYHFYSSPSWSSLYVLCCLFLCHFVFFFHYGFFSNNFPFFACHTLFIRCMYVWAACCCVW